MNFLFFIFRQNISTDYCAQNIVVIRGFSYLFYICLILIQTGEIYEIYERMKE